MSSIGRIQWLVDFHLHTRNGARRQFSLSQSLWKAPQRRILGGQIEGSQTGWDWCLDFKNLLVRNMQFSLVKPIFRNSINQDLQHPVCKKSLVLMLCVTPISLTFYTPRVNLQPNNRQDEEVTFFQPIQHFKSNTFLYHHLYWKPMGIQWIDYSLTLPVVFYFLIPIEDFPMVSQSTIQLPSIHGILWPPDPGKSLAELLREEELGQGPKLEAKGSVGGASSLGFWYLLRKFNLFDLGCWFQHFSSCT